MFFFKGSPQLAQGVKGVKGVKVVKNNEAISRP